MKSSNTSQIIKFTLFSISAGVIQALSFALLNNFLPKLTKIHMGYWPCYLIALVASVLWNFTFNRKFTFKSAANVPLAMTKVAVYYAVFTPLSTWLGHLATVKFSIPKESIGEYIVLIITMLVNFITEFLYDKHYVFKEANQTVPDKQ